MLSTKYFLLLLSVFVKGFFVIASTRMPNAFALFATSIPVTPKPIIARVFPCNSTVGLYFIFVVDMLERLLPSLCVLLLIFLAKYRMRNKACSATEIALAIGTFATYIPLVVHSFTSILSTPIPDCCTNFNSGHRSKIDLFILLKPFTMIFASTICGSSGLL